MARFTTYIFGCVGIFFFYSYAAAQDVNQERLKVDSLKALYQSELDQYRLVDLSNEIAVTYGIISIDSSLVYSNNAKQLAEQLNYSQGLATSYNYIARASAQIGEMKVALNNYNLALELFICASDSVNILDTYRGMAYVVSYGDNQLASLDYNRKALGFAEELKDTISLSVIYNNIATIYTRLGNYELALLYLEKTIAIEKRYQDPIDMAITYSNMGILKIEHGNLNEAAHDYDKINVLLPKINNDYVRAYLYLSLAGYYTSINEFQLAKQYLAKADGICNQNNYKHIQARVYRQYGELFLKEKQYKKSIQYFDKGLHLSEVIGVSEEYPKIYKMRAEAYAQLGKYSKAYESSRKANSAIDSLKSKKVASFLLEFEDQKAKEELNQERLALALKEQQAENVTIKLRNKFVVAIVTIVLLLICIGFGIYFFLKVRRSNGLLRVQHIQINEQKLLLEESIHKLEISEGNLTKLNATKDKFFSIIAHDLKSPFIAILGYTNQLSLCYKEYSDEERMEMIDRVGSASKSTYSLLENLLTWSSSQSGFIDLNKEPLLINNLVEESILPNLPAAEIKNIQVLNNIDEGILVWVDKETTKIVILNIFNNAIKFSNQGGIINLSSKLNNGMLEICIQDAGIGMSEQILSGLFMIEKNVQRKGTKEEKGTGLGLILCQEFINKNNGEIWAKSKVHVGSEIYFSLPLYQNN